MMISHEALDLWLDLNGIVQAVVSKYKSLNVVSSAFDLERTMASEMYNDFVTLMIEKNMQHVLYNNKIMLLLEHVLKVEYTDKQLHVLQLFSLCNDVKKIDFSMFNDRNIFWIGSKISKNNNILIGINAITGTYNLSSDIGINAATKSWIGSLMDDVLHFVTDVTDILSDENVDTVDTVDIWPIITQEIKK